MQEDKLFMMSPMDATGEDRLRKVRAYIHKEFGPNGRGRRAKRALDMPADVPTPVKTPRTRLRQRIEQASQLSANHIFFQQFGSREELMKTEFDLARPANHSVSKVSTRFDVASTCTTSAIYSATAAPTAGPTNYLPFGSPLSTLAASSTAKVSQLTRPKRIETPRKPPIKRGRAGESSAEKALVLQKPRLGGVSARGIVYSSRTNSPSGKQAPTRPLFEPYGITTHGEKTTLSSRVYSRASPSKFHFSSSASRLFSQRQTPLR